MPDKKKIEYYYMSYGIVFGLLGGALFTTIIGIFIETPLIWAFGPGIGMLAGIIIGAIKDSNKGHIKKEEVDQIIKIALVAFIGMILILLIPKIIAYLF